MGCASGGGRFPALERIAKRACCIVLLSAPLKTAHPLFQQPNPSRARAELVERLIESVWGLQWTFLRPGMFATNALGWWAPQIRVGDIVRWPYLQVPTALDRTCCVISPPWPCARFREDSHSGAEYVLTGPQSLKEPARANRHRRFGCLAAHSASKRFHQSNGCAGYRIFCRRLWRSICWTPGPPRLGNPPSLASTVEELTGSPARSFPRMDYRSCLAVPDIVGAVFKS